MSLHLSLSHPGMAAHHQAQRVGGSAGYWVGGGGGQAGKLCRLE